MVQGKWVFVILLEISGGYAKMNVDLMAVFIISLRISAAFERKWAT